MTKTLQDIVTDDTVRLFVNKMKEFDASFVASLIKGEDFTIRLEVRGNKGEVLHIRLYEDSMSRVNGAERRIDKKGANDD